MVAEWTGGSSLVFSKMFGVSDMFQNQLIVDEGSKPETRVFWGLGSGCGIKK